MSLFVSPIISFKCSQLEPPVMSTHKVTFQPPASELYSPVSAFPACYTTSRWAWPWVSSCTFELALSFFSSLNDVTSFWVWATLQLSMAVPPITVCPSLNTGCSLANDVQAWTLGTRREVQSQRHVHLRQEGNSGGGGGRRGEGTK